MIALSWRIYYEDGSTFDNMQGAPDQAPPFGVQAVTCLPDLWGCGDILGLVQYLITPGLSKCVRFGSLASNARFQRAFDSANSDPDFDPGLRHVYFNGDYYWWNGGRQ